MGSRATQKCLQPAVPATCLCRSFSARRPGLRRTAAKASAVHFSQHVTCRPVTSCSLLPPVSRLGSHRPSRGFQGGLRQQSRASVRARNGICVQISAAAVAEAETHHPDVQAMLDRELPAHPDLTIGHLENGLRYVILPNKMPPDRMEVHLEVHAGSVDEGPEEQGVAHFVEHVTFLGSRKRENLLGTGCRSNAYTDFQHTVFHVHLPLSHGTTGRPMLPQVLEALREVAFEAEFADSRIEKERRAVLSEAGMMNSIEYRVDCKLLGWLHAENALGHRFPIGKTDQVGRWEGDVLRSFWRRWYYPANCTLYVVGDLDRSIPEIEALVKSTYDRILPGREVIDVPSSNGAQLHGATEVPAPAQSIQLGPLKPRQLVRPPVMHDFGFLVNGAAPKPAPIQIFQHRLLQQYCLSIFCKLPIAPIQRLSGLRRGLLVRMLISVLTFRINSRYSEPGSRFLGIELDISDSAREGCIVSTLTITSEAGDWRSSTQVAIQEVRRLQKYGFTATELDRYLSALLRDSAQLALSSDAISHQQNLEFAMDSIALEHTFTHPSESFEQLSQAAQGVTLEEVNGLCRSLLSFASHYGREDELAEEARQQPDMWTQGPPTRATSIVACVPMHVDASGQSIGPARPLQRGSSMAMTEHVDDPAAAAAALSSEDPLDKAGASEDEVPEGAVLFKISESDIANVLAEQSLEIQAKEEVDTPEFLMEPAEVQQMVADQQPHFVPVTPGGSTLPAADPATGIVQRRLSNGLALNARVSDVEPQAALLRLSCVGGRVSEPSTSGPDGQGAIMVGTRAVSESGAVGSWRREQLELFCISRLINCSVEATEEQVVMDFSFPVGENGLKAVLELLHLFVTEPCWTEGAMYRAKQAFRSHYLSLPKSLERSTADRILTSMLGSDRRFRDSTTEDLDALTLDGMRSAFSRLLHPQNLELSIVGDIDLAELDALAPVYLGTIKGQGSPPDLTPAPLVIQRPAPQNQMQSWHLKDSDQRAFAYIAGPVPSEWAYRELHGPIQPGSIVTPRVLPRNASPEQVQQALADKRKHPLYTGVVLALLVEVMNGRLFTTVRDALGLTYDVSFELALFELLKNGWFSVSVTSSPEKIHETAEACVRVLRAPGHSPITTRELERARRTLITRHETDSKENPYWLGLMTRTQCSYTPWRTLESIRDIRPMYDAIDLQDMHEAYSQFQMGDDSLFVCYGTSGQAPPQEAPSSTSGLESFEDQLQFVQQGGFSNGTPSMGVPMDQQQNQEPFAGQQLQEVKKTAQMAAMAAAANNLAKNFDFSKALEQMQQELQDKRSKS